MKAAYLVDGGFFIQKYKQEFKRHPTAQEIKTFIEKLHTLHSASAEIFRIYYYDCPPADQEIETAISKTKIQLKSQPAYLPKRRYLSDLKNMHFFAVREGVLKFDGWEQKPKVKTPTKDDDFKMKFRQKGVDMKIGLDISWLSMGKIVDRIMLVTGDSDFVPAMKFARRQGIQVFLATLNHGVIEQLKEHADCHFSDSLKAIFS